MGSYIGTWKDYFNIQQEEFLKQNNVKTFEDFFNNLYKTSYDELSSAYESSVATAKKEYEEDVSSAKNAYDFDINYANSMYNQNINDYAFNYTTKTNAIQKQTRYDISNAYANYKKSQLNLMQQNKLGTGFKDYYTGQLKSDFEQTVSSYKSSQRENLSVLRQQYESSLTKEELDLLNKTTSLTDTYESKLRNENRALSNTLESLASGYEKGVASLDSYKESAKKEIEKELEESSKKYAQIEGIIREIAGIDDSNSDKYYETITDAEKGTKTIKLKDLGKDEFDRILNSRFTDTDAFITKDPNDKTKEKKYYSLTDYLFDLDQDLYDFYVANKSNINKWVAGLEADDSSYSKEEREIERKQIEGEIQKLIDSQSDSDTKLHMQKRLENLSKQTFNKYSDKTNAYASLKEEFSKPAIKITETTTLNPEELLKKVPDEYYIKDANKDVYSKLGLVQGAHINLQQSLNKAGLKSGDVVKIDGKTYLIKYDHSWDRRIHVIDVNTLR